MAKPPNIRAGGRSQPSGYVVGRAAPGRGDAQLVDMLTLGAQLNATGVPGTSDGGVPLTIIANQRLLGNGSGSPALPVALSVTMPAAGITLAWAAGGVTYALANDLAALEGLGSTGIAVRTAADTWAQRTLQPPAAGITITNPAGVAGDPTFVLANDLAALEAMSSTGLVARTASETYAQRTITGTANRLSVSNGGGVAGNPTLDIDAAYVGQTSITTLGTVTTGTWNAGIIAGQYGGTGVANTGLTITLAGNLVHAGAFTTTITATATTNSTLPAGTHTLAGLDVIQTWSANQSFNSGNFLLKGATSGTITLNAAATAGANTLTLPAGTTDFSATGGTSQVLKQSSAGAAITVGQLAASDLSGGIATANGILKGDGAGAVTAATFEADFGLPTPHLDFDFTTGLYWDAPNNPANPLTFTRASTAYISSDGTDAGTWTSVATGVLRRNSIGAVIEEARTNSLRNNSTTGAVAGSPGTLPTNWSITRPTGLTQTLAIGTTNGVEYIEINLAGTTSSTAAIVIILEAATQIASVNNDIWSTSAWVSNSASTGIGTALVCQLQMLDGAGANLGTVQTISGLKDIAWGRVGGVGTVNNASTAFVRQRFGTNSITSGTVVNMTMRIGWPQMEKVTDTTFTYSSPIRTTSAAVTRAADVLDVNLPPTVGTSYTLRAKGIPQYATTYNADQYALAVSDGTSTNRFGILRLAATAIPQWIINSTKTAIGASAWAIATSKHLVAANAVSSQAASFDGAAVVTGSSATSPTGLTKVSIGHDGTGANQFNGIMQRIVVWPGVRLGNQAVVSVASASIAGQGYVSPAGATYQASPGNPTGTTDTTGKMMGLAGSITPAKGGDVLLIASGTIFNATAIADGAKVQLRYGTGTAPANADALTGTTAGAQPQYIASTTAGKVPFSCNAVVSGLTRGTAYWVDLALAAITAGTATITDVSLSVVEL